MKRRWCQGRSHGTAAHSHSMRIRSACCYQGRLALLMMRTYCAVTFGVSGQGASLSHAFPIHEYHAVLCEASDRVNDADYLSTWVAEVALRALWGGVGVFPRARHCDR